MRFSDISFLFLGSILGQSAYDDVELTPPFVRLIHDSYYVPVSTPSCLFHPNKIAFGGGVAPYTIEYVFEGDHEHVWTFKKNALAAGEVDWLAGRNLEGYDAKTFRFRITDSEGQVAYDVPHGAHKAGKENECAERLYPKDDFPRAARSLSMDLLFGFLMWVFGVVIGIGASI